MTDRHQKKRVLLVGLEYSGPPLRGVSITTKGLCRPKIAPKHAAAPLYEYDVIIINPVSYSHFIFGRAGQHSDSEKELWDLKKENNDYDLDLLFATGMRVGEASALNLVDFTVSESCFRVEGKGGRDRLAFVVDEQTLRIQREHVELRSNLVSKSPALFLNAAGERLSTQGIANVISQFRKDAGIERHITPHMLRHTVAALLLRNGVDIRVVQEFLGHASIATTQRYTHVTKDHLVKVLRERHPSLALRSVS